MDGFEAIQSRLSFENIQLKDGSVIDISLLNDINFMKHPALIIYHQLREI